MKVETYLAKFYDVEVAPFVDYSAAEDGQVVDGVAQIDIFEKGEDSEPIGFFIKRAECDIYEYRNVYGKVATGTIYTETELKAAAKAGVFCH